LQDLWTPGCRGDQAYFFMRAPAAPAFANGSIVALREGALHPADGAGSPAMYLVVSDLNAKWKGGAQPSKPQEALGHWCAFLGQVPLTVIGPCRAGDLLGPVLDGSGRARAATLGAGPIVGMALAAQPVGTGVVKAMVSVGLNALAALEKEVLLPPAAPPAPRPWR